MRWVVEWQSQDSSEVTTVTVDGDSWKAALTAARKGRGLTRFRCDFEHDGSIVVRDIVTAEKFTLRSEESMQATAPPPSEEVTTMVSADIVRDSAPLRPSRTSLPVVVTTLAPPAPEPVAQSVASPAPTPAAASALPNGTALLFERNREPGTSGGLSYRERVVAIEQGATSARAEDVARAIFRDLQLELGSRPRGKMVSIAVFDHVFSELPERPPLVVLTWKDWHGDQPTLASQSAPLSPSIPPPHSPSVVPAQEQTVANEAPNETVILATATAQPVESLAEPALASQPFPSQSAPERRISLSIPPGPVRGDDMLAAAFEITNEMSSVASAEEACSLLADALAEVVDAQLVAVSLYEINQDCFRLIARSDRDETHGRTTPLSAGLRGESARRDHVIRRDAQPESDPFLTTSPTGPCCFVPVRGTDERLYAMLEAHRTEGSAAFADGERDALMYVAEKFGKLLEDLARANAALEAQRKRRR